MAPSSWLGCSEEEGGRERLTTRTSGLAEGELGCEWGQRPGDLRPGDCEVPKGKRRRGRLGAPALRGAGLPFLHNQKDCSVSLS